MNPRLAISNTSAGMMIEMRCVSNFSYYPHWGPYGPCGPHDTSDPCGQIIVVRVVHVCLSFQLPIIWLLWSLRSLPFPCGPCGPHGAIVSGIFHAKRSQQALRPNGQRCNCHKVLFISDVIISWNSVALLVFTTSRRKQQLSVHQINA